MENWDVHFGGSSSWQRMEIDKSSWQTRLENKQTNNCLIHLASCGIHNCTLPLNFWNHLASTTVWSIWHHQASTTLYSYTSSSSPYLTLLDIALKPAATQWRFRFRKASSHWTENDLQHISTQKTSVAKQVAYHASCTSQAEQRRTPPSWTSTYPSHLDQPLICQACCERSRNTWETNNNHTV